MIKKMSELLRDAEEKNYAVMGIDFLSRPMLRLLIRSAEKHRAPLIAMFPDIPLNFWNMSKSFQRDVLQMCEEATIPVCLHLDHGKTVEVCRDAIEAGFTSVMIDGSSLPYKENVSVVRQVVESARQRGVEVEAEIGHVGSGKGTIEGRSDESFMTDPDEALRFGEETEADSIAVSVGTVHGTYRGEPKIDLRRLREINALVPVPLVLHGGSGTGDDNIREMVSSGIRKINLFTEWIKAYLKATKRFYLTTPWKIFIPGAKDAARFEAADEVLGHYFEISGSSGRA